MKNYEELKIKREIEDIIKIQEQQKKKISP